MEGIPAELTQSMWGDVLKQCGGDKDKAKDLLRGMEDQEKEKDRERKLRELEGNFPDTPKEIILKVLSDNNWDVEAAILPLFEYVEQQKQAEKEREREQQQKKREQERVERKRQAIEQAQTFLQNLFANIPGEKIQAILDQNEGDVDATTEQLLGMVGKSL
jgi:chromatin segregation and condensation protein Rec8/ScpA/Scc1 (kleisin family)